MDETSKQQVKETWDGGLLRFEYERNGVSNLFMLFAPLEGWRRVEVTDRRTKADWARVVKQLVDEDYPHKDRIVLVMDNLNTHHPSSLYEEFEPAEARRIAERLEIHYTPKHGSWLDMAEIEIGVMVRQCLDRRIPDQSVLRREVGAWQQQRNRDAIRVDWRFTTEDARIKLKNTDAVCSNQVLTYTAVLCQRITTVPVATPVAACSSPPASPLHTPGSPHACELLDIRRRTTPRFPCRAAEIVRLGNVMRVGRRVMLCTKPVSASTPICIFMPKCHSFPFLVWCVSGSLSLAAVLGGRWRLDYAGVHNGSLPQPQPLRFQMPVDILKQTLP